MNKERIAALILTAAITLGGASGCANQNIDAVDTTPPAASDTLTPETTTPSTTTPTTETTSPTTSVTSTPEVSSTPTETEVNAELALAPDIDGLTKQVQNDEVVYMTNESNPYGLESDLYAGEYKSEVTVDGTQTGGVALVPEVVQVLLEDELSKIPEGDNKLKIIIPLDISNLDKTDGVEIISNHCASITNSNKQETNVDKDFLILKVDQKVPFTNPFLNTNTIGSSPDNLTLSFQESSRIQDLTVMFPSNYMGSSNILDQLMFFFPKESLSNNSLKGEYLFGGNLDTNVESLIVACCLSDGYISLKISDLLYSGNCPVFLSATQTAEK